MLAIKPLLYPIDTSITIPGSKSDTNRALILASLAYGLTTLRGISHSDDSKILIENLKKLGIIIENIDETTIKVHGNGGYFKPFYGELNSGIAGTTSRFLAALCALVPGKFTLKAEVKMLDRPMGELFEALQNFGCSVDFLGKLGRLPVEFHNENIIHGGDVELDGGISSQFFTALLLISPILPGGLNIRVKNQQVSQSYIDMTQSILRDFGIEMINDNYKNYTIHSNQKLISQDYHIQGDASGCSYFWGLAAITRSTIRVCNIHPDSVQGDVQFADILEKMGCVVVKNSTDSWIEVTGTDTLKGIDVDMENLPDTAQTLSVIAAFGNGETTITGLSTLKKKETDRLFALNTELAKMGIITEIGEDWIKIRGGFPYAATIETYHDHRMAMSFALAGCKIPNIMIQNPEVVSKSFPHFWSELQNLGVTVEYV